MISLKGVTMKRSVLVLLILFVATQSGTSLSNGLAEAVVGVPQTDEPFRVQLEMKTDTDLKVQLSSFIGRELRTLGDVVIVESKPDYNLHVLSLQLTTVGGRKAGIAVHSQVTSPIDFKERFSPFLKCDLSGSGFNLRLVEIFATGYVSIETGNIYSGNHDIDGIRNMATRIVTSLDSDVLEPRRAEQRIMKEALQEQQ